MDAYNIKVITYEATGEQDIVTYQKPIQTKKQEDLIDGNAEPSIKEEPTQEQIIAKAIHSLNTSLSRTKQAVYDYARANKWDWFFTITFDPKQIDRHDYEQVSKKFSKWIDNIRQRKAPDMKYIIVPELHKDGAYHFHALVSNTGTLKIVDSGFKIKGMNIYNISDFKLGFTTATQAKDTLKASNYITK